MKYVPDFFCRIIPHKSEKTTDVLLRQRKKKKRNSGATRQDQLQQQKQDKQWVTAEVWVTEVWVTVEVKVRVKQVKGRQKVAQQSCENNQVPLVLLVKT
jgi:hypothetical protein